MALKKWLELSVELRRSFYKRWNYLAGEVDGLKKWHQLRPHLRKRESDRWNYLAEFVEGLKKWHQLGPHLRRSESDRWNYLADTLNSEDTTPEPEPETPVTRNFEFYSDSEGNNQMNSGVVEPTGETKDNCIQIIITEAVNSALVGQKFYVDSSAINGTIYPLYVIANEELRAAGVYIKFVDDE